MANLHSLPFDERPRERLLQKGASALSIIELLAILLGTGAKDKSVLLLASELLHKFHDLDGLLDASIEELRQVKGIGEAKAVLLKAAFGLAQRKAQASLKFPIKSAQEAFELAQDELKDSKQEIALVLLRDVKGRLFHKERVAVGTLSEVLIHPREVFHPAVRHKASSLILVHNHPSGDPTPSASDLQLTKLLHHSSKVMGIALDDHLIVGFNSYVSLRERGLLGTSTRY